MPSPSTFSAREREARSRLHLLLNQTEDFIHGSPIEMSRRCGNPNCRCASNDKYKHTSLCLGQTSKGVSSTVYIPRDLETKVREGIANFQQARDLLEELNVEARIRLNKAKAKRVSKKRAKRKSLAKIQRKNKLLEIYSNQIAEIFWKDIRAPWLLERSQGCSHFSADSACRFPRRVLCDVLLPNG